MIEAEVAMVLKSLVTGKSCSRLGYTPFHKALMQAVVASLLVMVISPSAVSGDLWNAVAYITYRIQLFGCARVYIATCLCTSVQKFNSTSLKTTFMLLCYISCIYM